MPMVPKYEYPQVDNVLPPDQRGHATAQAFGGGLGAGLSSIGKETEKIGDVLASHAIKMQTLVNQADADQKSSDYIIAQSELDSQHRQLEGKARADNFQNYIQKSKELRDKLSGSMKNPEARRLFDSETRKYFAYSVRNEAYGVGTELKKHNTQANTRLLSTSEELVENDPYNDAVFDTALGTSKRAVRQEGQNKSWDAATLEQKEAQVETNLRKKRIKTIALDDPEKATELLEKNKDKILRSDRVEVEAAIASGKQVAGSKAALMQQNTRELVKSDIQSRLQTGQGNPMIRENTVRALLGEKAAEDWKAERTDATKVWWHTHQLPTTSADVMQKELNNLTPTPGAATFARDQKTYNTVRKTMEDQLSLRNQDPAESVANDPIVSATMKQASNDKTGLINARLAAQTRASIPAELQSPITVAEAEQVMLSLKRVLPGQERQALTQAADKFKKTYGDHWEQAFAFALRAERRDAETARLGATVLKRLMAKDVPSIGDARVVDEAVENNAAQNTVKELNVPILGEWGQPINPTRSESELGYPMTRSGNVPENSISKRILDKYPENKK